MVYFTQSLVNSVSGINRRESLVVGSLKTCNYNTVESIISDVYHRLLFLLRKRRFHLNLFACAFLAVGCAHHHDAASGDSQDQPHRNFGHRDPNLETETETTTSYRSPTPSPAKF